MNDADVLGKEMANIFHTALATRSSRSYEWAKEWVEKFKKKYGRTPSVSECVAELDRREMMQSCYQGTPSTRFVTHWALTEGIIEMEGHIDGGYFFAHKRKDSYSASVCVPLKEASISLDLARIVAKDMAKRKVASLKKQVAKYERFEPKVNRLEKKA